MRIFALGLGYCARRLIALAQHFEAAGTVRSPEAVAALRAEGVEAFLFDGARRDPALEPALARAEALIVSIPPGPGGDPALAALAPEIAGARALKRIVYLSTVGVYGDWGGAWVDETSPTRATTPRGRRRIEAEARWQALGSELAIPVDILRLAGIYGPGRNSLVKLREGDARRIVKPGQVFNRIHVDDIAGAALALLAADGAGGVWNLADREPAPPQDVIAFAAALMGAPLPPEEPFEGAELSEMARSFYDDNRRISIAKLERDLGYSLLYPTYREGLTALWQAGEGR